MTPKKILIISLAAGTGHVKAASAILKTAEEKFSSVIARHIDLKEYITYPFKKASMDAYEIMAKRTPKFWGFLYEMTDSAKTTKRFNILTKHLKQINSLKFYQEIKDFAPDYIICTHFLPAELILNSPKGYANSTPVSVVLTDYDLHNFWLIQGLSHYFVATEKMKWKIVERKKQTLENITVSGIPIDPVFYQEKPTAELREKYKIPMDKPVVLVLSGGQGLVRSDKLVKELFSIESDFEIIAIAGKNTQQKSKLEKLSPPKNIALKIIGWTDTMDEYMKLSDLIITKPGGLTITECIASKKPIIAFDPIPGQEEVNAKYLLENNFGKVASSYEDAKYYFDYYLKNKNDFSKPVFQKTAAEIILEQIIK